MPDIAIVDIGMPGMDGFAVARAIRSSGAYQHLLLVALTGYASESDAARALAARFDCHLASRCRLTNSTQFCGRGCAGASCMVVSESR